MEKFRTIPEMLLTHARRFGNDRAINDRIGGNWVPVSIEQLIEQVSALAAMLDLHLSAPGSCVGVLAAPSSQWLAIDMAIMLAGGVSVPFFVDFSESHLKHKIKDSGMKIIFVLGDALWQRFEPFADRFDLVITDQHPQGQTEVVHFDEMIAWGRERLTSDAQLVPHLLERIRPDDLAVIIYTSGSTGLPKGVELTHRNLVSQLHDFMPLFPIRAGEDRGLSLLPVAHTFERIVIYMYLAQGMCIYFVDDLANIARLMQEVEPTMMTVVPRLLEKTHARIGARTAVVRGLKGRLARWAFKQANRVAPPDEKKSFRSALADRIVGGKVQKAFGGKLRMMVVGGAHMPVPLHHFFVRVGIPLYEGYGLTEAAPVICTNFPGSRRVGSVGPPLASVEIKLGEEGEVLARGPNIMRGYRHLPEETARVLDDEGWLHTGDLGHIDGNGFLTILARQKEMYKTSTGKSVIPGPIERALCQEEWAEMACVVAEARKYASCLLFVDESIATDQSATRMHEQVKAHIRAVNETLAHWEQIRAYAIVTELPSVANGELTPTLKLRRHVVEEHYGRLIERLYKETRGTEELHEFEIGYC